MKRWLLTTLWAFGVTASALAQGGTTFTDLPPVPNKLSNGGFEANKPAYWDPSGTGAAWTTAQAHSAPYSLALSGAGAASWTMGEAVRNWTDYIGQHGPNGFTPGEIKVSAWVRAVGVNVNPTNDAGKYQLVFEFFNQAGGTNILGQPVVIDLPQTAANTNGWVKVDNLSLGAISLPQAARSVRITFRKGANATGTMYLDDVYVEAANWPGTIHNGSVDAGDTWYYYTPDAENGYANGQTFINGVTTEQARTGSRSLKIQQLKADAPEAVQISQRVPVTPGRPVLVSYWVKTEGNTSPSTIGTGDNNIGITALWYSNMTGGAAGYGEVGGVDIRLNGEYNAQVIPLLPRQAANGWTQYAFVLTPPVRAANEAPVVGMELRLRYWHTFTGTTYWDDVVIADVSDVVAALNSKLPNGGFETNRPAYWMPSGAGATWSTNARSAGRALALSGAGAASWTMGEAVRNWTDYIGQHGPNGFTPGEVVISGYVKAEGVNTFAGGDDNKYQLVVEFFNQAGGTNILGQPVVIDLPQTSANTGGYVKFDNLSLGSIILPQAARSVRITFRKGAGATGTMYLDDLTISAANWPGTIHNGTMDAGDTWYYYTPDAEASYPNGQTFINGVMASAARTGSNGLLIKRNGPVGSGEAVHITPRVPVAAGRPQLITFWLKTANVPNPATIGTGDNNIGLTGLWYTNMTGGAAGYGEVGGFDVRFNGEYNDRVIPNYRNDANGDWKQYAVVAYPPVRGANEAPVVGMEVRLRYWHAFQGDAMFDDVRIIDLGGTSLATAAEEDAREDGTRSSRLTAYPNPFQGRTTLAFQLTQPASVTLDVFDVLGRRVARLADGEVLAAGTHLRTLDGSDLNTGTYVCVIRVGDRTDTRLVSLVR